MDVDREPEILDPEVRAATSQLKLGGKIAKDFGGLVRDAKERLAEHCQSSLLPPFNRHQADAKTKFGVVDR